MGLIYLDSCIIIYAVENHPLWGAQSKAAITEHSTFTMALSPLVKLECLVAPLKQSQERLAARYRDFFSNFDTLEMPEAVYLAAAELHGRFGLRAPDALHLACAKYHHCEALWTNNNRLSRAAEGFMRNIFV